MDLHWVSAVGSESHPVTDLPTLRSRPEGFAWIDVPHMDPESAAFLRESLSFDSHLIGECSARTLIPKVFLHDGKLLLVLHSLDREGHLLQLDIVVGEDFLVTIHGPLTEGLPVELALREKRAILERVEQGRLIAERPIDLVVALIEEIAGWLEHLLAAVSSQAGTLDRRLRERRTGDPESFLEEAFSTRHDLVTIANRAGQSHEACEMASGMVSEIEGATADRFGALGARFSRLRTQCGGEKEFLQGVLDFYESQVNTKMNIAMERLAVIAAVALPITAIGGIVGMNTIVNTQTDVLLTLLIIGFMALLGGFMLRWAKRKGWW